jgi:hypothetical protein
MKRNLPVVIFILLNTFLSNGRSFKSDTTLVFFSGNKLYPTIFPDPLECQISGSSCFLFRDKNNVSLYSPVNLGFTKPFLSGHLKSVSWEANFGAGTFTQFDLVRQENGRYLAGLLNNDYKVSIDFSVQKGIHLLRLRVFHVSSHLGDDYILRHNISEPNDKSQNYEQADITYLRLTGNNYWYAGAGEIYTKWVFRKRFSLNFGGLKNFGRPAPVNIFISANLKLVAENDFIPDLRTAFGINFNRRTKPMVRFWVEYYSGQLPYSTLKYGRINWAGLGMTINLQDFADLTP